MKTTKVHPDAMTSAVIQCTTHGTLTRFDAGQKDGRGLCDEEVQNGPEEGLESRVPGYLARIASITTPPTMQF